MNEPTMTEHDCGCVTCPTHTEQPVPEAPADAFGNDPDRTTRAWNKAGQWVTPIERANG